ncbi:flagellar hook-length control protein FliK [Bdellovibrio sp. HCB337]|uniref:flagellar hook-length control protein FliK n=1 Tax=Bdellovibrio sp. HCB337 TaxID=3394358 RepID=UPI0039A4D112
MLQSIVGPPLKGVADFKSSENPQADLTKDAKKAGSDSFGSMLDAKVAPKAKEREEMKPTRADSPRSLREKAPPEKTERVEREDKRRPESDDRAEKVTATKGNGSEKKVKGSSQRENAILNFMDSFESEFGVPPTRIVEAMANLKPTDQVDAPEATADQVIGQLGLDDQQEDQAKEMYMGLLAQLAQIDKTPQPQQKPMVQPEAMYAGSAMTGAVAQERFTSAQEKRQVLNSSLDSMNQKFWMKGGGTAPQATGTELADKLAQMNMQEKMMQPQGLQIDESLLNTRMADLQQQAPVADLQNPLQGRELAAESEGTQSPEAALAALVAAARAAKNKAEMKGLGAQEEMSSEFGDATSLETQAPTPEAMQGKALPKGEAAAVMMTQTPQKGFEFGQQQQQEGFNQSAQSSAKGEIQAKTKDGEKLDFKKSLGMEGLSTHQLPSLKQEAALGGAAAAAATQAPVTANKAENEANVRQIMNQAQYLIKKGGGEMKVEMTPEGLGKIHMKVLVQDGKVNVQMAADTQEAKKTLESSLSDLKNSLAAHKLSMDHVKIDVVAGTNADNSTQNQMNQNNPGSREQTQKFWNNFNENFGSHRQQRDGFADVPNLRGYARPRTDQPLEPIRSASVNKYAAAGKGKGLDLVA